MAVDCVAIDRNVGDRSIDKVAKARPPECTRPGLMTGPLGEGVPDDDLLSHG